MRKVRGRKATLHLDGSDLKLSSSTEPSEDDSPSTTASSSIYSISLIERVLSNPIVAFFTCSDSSGNQSLNRSIRGNSKTYFKSAIQTGAPKAVVQAMKQFPHNARIQRMGCGALRDMAVDSWPSKTRVMEAGGVEAVLKAMRLHAKDQKVQELACACIYHLIAGDLPILLVQRGVVGALLIAIDNHAEDEDVLLVACDCLLALTDESAASSGSNPHSSEAAIHVLRQKLGGVVLARIEHHFRGQNGEIQRKTGELLRRLYQG